MAEVFAVIHNDLDGAASGGVIQRKYGAEHVTILQTNYDKNLPIKRMMMADIVVVADFSLSAISFKALLDAGKTIIWLDHHIDNVKKIEAELRNLGVDPSSIAGIRDDQYCGALLCWKYFFADYEVPRALLLIDDFDRWQWKYKEDTTAFFYGIDLFDNRPGTKNGNILWSQLLESLNRRLAVIISTGRMVADYCARQNKVWVDDLAFPAKLDGFSVLAINLRLVTSLVFDHAENRNSFDAMTMFGWASDTGRYRYSIYSPDNKKEVLPIAVSHGGGGHPYASGWSSDNIEVELPKEVAPALEEAIAPYRALADEVKQNQLLQQCVAKRDTIALRSMGYFTEFEPMKVPAIGLNTPYLPNQLEGIKYHLGVISSTGYVAQVAVGYNIVKCGKYRVCVAPLLPTVDLERLRKAVPGGKIIDGNVWYYTDKCPILQLHREN